jgi:hypothetical protein
MTALRTQPRIVVLAGAFAVGVFVTNTGRLSRDAAVTGAPAN